MKTRIRNVLILLLGILVLGIIFNINQVRAEEVEEDYIKNIMDKIPDTMNIDIPEIEYEKAYKVVAEKVEKILIDNGLEYKKEDNNSFFRQGIVFELENKTIKENKINIEVDGPALYLEDINTATIQCKNIVNKNVKLIYNNQNNYNLQDESYVKDLKLQSPKYYELDISYFKDWGEVRKGLEIIRSRLY